MALAAGRAPQGWASAQKSMAVPACSADQGGHSTDAHRRMACRQARAVEWSPMARAAADSSRACNVDSQSARAASPDSKGLQSAQKTPPSSPLRVPEARPWVSCASPVLLLSISNLAGDGPGVCDCDHRLGRVNYFFRIDSNALRRSEY
jgi:hypothetical protein